MPRFPVLCKNIHVVKLRSMDEIEYFSFEALRIFLKKSILVKLSGKNYIIMYNILIIFICIIIIMVLLHCVLERIISL